MSLFSGQTLGDFMQSAHIVILAMTLLIHLLFAGAVARDAGSLHKRGLSTQLVSGITWAFATLMGGVFVAAIYWFIHHVRDFYRPK